MHLLLPPSEAKTAGGRGRPLRDRPVDDDPLGQARAAALAALTELLRGDPVHAARALLLPAGVATDALAANAGVLDSRTMPALRRYAGVVYEGLDHATFSADEQRVAARTCFVFSGLFGVVRGDEPIPDYRVPAKAVLPRLGIARTFWRPVLSDVLPSRLRRGLIVDLRSGDYAGMWRPERMSAERVVTVRILSPAPGGGHAVISYNSKFAKGRLAAALIRRRAAGDPVDDIDSVVSAWHTWDGAADAVRSRTGVDLYTR